MAGKVCGDFYQQLGNQMLKGNSGVTYTVRLYTNNYTPVLNSAVGSFTECTDGSYASWQPGTGGWTVTDSSGVVSCTTGQNTFSFAGSNNIYGYYVTDPGKTKVFWAELFAGGPISYTSAGGQLYLSLELDGPSS